MDNKPRKKILIVFIGIFLLAVLILFISAFIIPLTFFAKTERVDANLLIVEGWLPSSSAESVKKEFHDYNYDMIIISGVKSSNLDYCTVGSLGTLIFYTQPFLGSLYRKDNHYIEVMAHSRMGGKYRAHFNLYINDSLVTDFTASKQKKKYGFSWYGSLSDIDSLLIEFDNDMVDENGDRDLYIKEIIVDKGIHISYQFNTVYEILTEDGKKRIPNNFNSNSGIVRNELIRSGIDSALVRSLSADKIHINRTLSSAMVTRDWLEKSDHGINGINVISLGIHSRRTWMTYKKILGETYSVGIISIPDERKSKSKIRKVVEIMYEITGIIYYRLLFLAI